MTSVTEREDETVTEDEAKAGDGDGATTSAGPGARLLAVFAVLLALAAAIFFGIHARNAAVSHQARQDALSAAETRVPKLLSYKPATLDEDLAEALEQTTGDFTADYGKILEGVVKPEAAARKISTKAAVSAAGVVSGDQDEVVVLLFLTQTTNAGDAGTSVAGSRVEVTMAKDGDDWKIARLKPL